MDEYVMSDDMIEELSDSFFSTFVTYSGDVLATTTNQDIDILTTPISRDIT